MALSWLWLVALSCMSLLFPSVLATIDSSSSNQDLFSPEKLPLIKRAGSLQCTYGVAPCGHRCCDASVSCVYNEYGLASCCMTAAMCPGSTNPCYGNTCLAGYTYCYANALCYPIIPANTPSESLTGYAYPSSTPTTTPSDPDAHSSDHESHGSSANLKAKKTTTLPRKTIGGIVSGLVIFFAALAAGIWRFLRKKRRSRVSESGAPGDLPEEHHGPPEYFKQPEVQTFPVSQPSPGFSPQK